jgi:hypothetical protein
MTVGPDEELRRAGTGVRYGAGNGIEGMQGGGDGVGWRGACGDPVTQFRIPILIQDQFCFTLPRRAERCG